MSEWKTIDSAPKDRNILACSLHHGDYEIEVVVWTDDYGWFRPDWDGSMDPTHWMEVPEPPQ